MEAPFPPSYDIGETYGVFNCAIASTVLEMSPASDSELLASLKLYEMILRLLINSIVHDEETGT